MIPDSHPSHLCRQLHFQKGKIDYRVKKLG